MELVDKWLSLFWSPGLFLLREFTIKGKNNIDYSKYYNTKTTMKINADAPYGAHFSPNWNLGKVNLPGEPIRKKAADTEDYISAVYIDLDMRHSSFTDKKKFLDSIIETIEKDKFRAHYMVESWDWFHIYSFIEPKERYSLWKQIKNDWNMLQQKLSSMFDGGDPEAHRISKTMRLPFSFYWKRGVAEEVKLFELTREGDKLIHTQVTKPEQITLEGKKMAQANWVLNFIGNQREITIKKTRWQNMISDISSQQIDNIDITDVIKKLEKYPRQFEGKEYVFKTDWRRIRFSIDGMPYHPWWYKINKEENYVHNFSFTEHSIAERPRWPVFVMLFHYFYKDLTKIDEFLTNEYWFSFSKGGDEIYLNLSTDTWTIYFTDKGVFYHTTQTKGKSIEDVQLKFFDTPIIIKGVIRTGYELHWETDDKNIYYIIQNLETDLEMIIDFKEDRKKFNRAYWKKWLMFMSWEMQILDFFIAINNAVKTGAIKEYDFRYLNWYYKDYYIMGDTIYDRTANKIEIDKTDLILNSPEVLKYTAGKDVSMSVFWEKLRWLFSDRQVMLAFTSFLALMLWHKFWEEHLSWYKQQILLPWLFVSWVSRSGKTTLLTILKNWCWMSYDSRKYSIASTTPQPLKQAATDDFILHLEEFTGDIWDTKETIVRDILNKAKTSRGMQDWENIYYKYRSSLILDWERMPKSESVANRCIVIPMFLEDKCGTEKLLWEFMNMSYQKAFLSLLYNINTEDVLQSFKVSEKTLSSVGIRDRNLLLYSFLLTVNNRFGIYKEEELIVAMVENLELQNNVDNNKSVLSALLTEVIIVKRTIPTMVDTEEGSMIIIPLASDSINENKINIINIMKRFSGKRVYMNGNNLIIKYNASDKWEKNVELYNTIILFSKYFKKWRFLDLD